MRPIRQKRDKLFPIDRITMSNHKHNPFRLDDIGENLQPFLARCLPGLERLSGLGRLGALYEELEPSENEVDFTGKALRKLNIGYHLHGEPLTTLAASGPAIVVANHPFGGIEGIIMAHLLKGYRDDVKILANGFLKRIPELGDLFIGVDPYATIDSTRRNRSPMREAVRWLRQEGVLVVFPAGDVSRFHPGKLRISDDKWDASISRLARMTSATVIPIYFAGRNSLLFHLLGMIHPRLRTLLLPRELLNKQDHCFSVTIGKRISHSRLQAYPDDNDAARYLRMHTMMLHKQPRKKQQSPPADQTEEISIIEPVDPAMMSAEIAKLGASQLLVDTDTAQVFCATAGEIPNILREIGRLREVTFRAVGEGTGQSLDLDAFDDYYRHLFIWNPQEQEIIGAYRLGLSDEILSARGKPGFYTSSLFRYSGQFLRSISPAIELGRSFIRQEYQRSFSPLMLLWKGIGQFVVRHPQYSRLFGPVSISNDYHSLSQQLLVDFLKSNSFDWQLGRFVRPRNAWKPKNKLRPIWKKTELEGIRSVEGISELVSVIEQDNKGMPILLKQYLKLGGRMLGFNVDNNFNDCLDGLVLVDLYETDPKVLSRYMGKDGASSFLASAKARKLA
jgi:putative hemolysin